MKQSKKPSKDKSLVQKNSSDAARAKYPRHSVEKALRIPKAILEQNAGRACTDKEAAAFVGVQKNGPFQVEVGSAIKYGFLERPEAGKLQTSPLAKQILRPHHPNDELDGYRKAILNAPDISEVYNHYRGENLPDDKFLKNAVVETQNIPADKFDEFKTILLESLEKAQLLTHNAEKIRVIDFTSIDGSIDEKSDRLKKLERKVDVHAGDICFVMQPFSAPLGGYYESVYKVAIEKAGLTPRRADADIFGTGKIMDQVWSGINSAKVLVAELTTRNPNVFYELGLAHALKKPVVLVSSNENDVPFDLHHIRVIYYDVADPFWGIKLIEKVAENILSAIKNPEEAVFKGSDST